MVLDRSMHPLIYSKLEPIFHFSSKELQGQRDGLPIEAGHSSEVKKRKGRGKPKQQMPRAETHNRHRHMVRPSEAGGDGPSQLCKLKSCMDVSEPQTCRVGIRREILPLPAHCPNPARMQRATESA